MGPPPGQRGHPSDVPPLSLQPWGRWGRAPGPEDGAGAGLGVLGCGMGAWRGSCKGEAVGCSLLPQPRICWAVGRARTRRVSAAPMMWGVGLGDGGPGGLFPAG